MPEFHYKAVTREGESDEGRVVEPDFDTAIRHLQESGLIPISAIEVASSSGRRATLRLPALFRRKEKPDVAAFTQSLASLTGAGTSLDRALEIMGEIEQHKATGTLIAEIQASVRGGEALSVALESQSPLFSTFYISMVRAAEISGALADGLERVIEYLNRSRELRERITSALIYPAILAMVAGLSVAILLLFVVPQFRSIFDEMGSALPLATRGVLALSDFLATYGWLLLVLVPAIGVGFKRSMSRPGTRRKLDAAVLRVPVFSDLVRNVETARLARSLGTMLRSGVPLLTGLGIAESTLSNRELASAVSEASINLREGGNLSTAFLKSAQFPALAIQMIKVGEETGQLDQMLLRVCELFERRVDTTTQRLLALMEPALIVTLGVLIAGIIMSILVGIISINDLPV